MTDEDYYCRSCWNRRSEPANVRCQEPNNHSRHEAVKVEIIVTSEDGSSIHIVSEDFDYTEFEVEQPKPMFQYWQDPLRMPLPTPPRDLTLTVKHAKTYKMWQETQQPELEDPTVVDEAQP